MMEEIEERIGVEEERDMPLAGVWCVLSFSQDGVVARLWGDSELTLDLVLDVG